MSFRGIYEKLVAVYGIIVGRPVAYRMCISCIDNRMLIWLSGYGNERFIGCSFVYHGGHLE